MPERLPQFFALDNEEQPTDAQLPDLVDAKPCSPKNWAQERREYEDFESQFAQFRQRQSEVEANVASLLERLNQQPDFFRVPGTSSVASSECGDLSEISSEWDTQSLGRTEDGLSVLNSTVNSICTTPQDSPRQSQVPSPKGSPPATPAGQVFKFNMSPATHLTSGSRQAAVPPSPARNKASMAPTTMGIGTPKRPKEEMEDGEILGGSYPSSTNQPSPSIPIATSPAALTKASLDEEDKKQRQPEQVELQERKQRQREVQELQQKREQGYPPTQGQVKQRLQQFQQLKPLQAQPQQSQSQRQQSHQSHQSQPQTQSQQESHLRPPEQQQQQQLSPLQKWQNEQTEQDRLPESFSPISCRPAPLQVDNDGVAKHVTADQKPFSPSKYVTADQEEDGDLLQRWQGWIVVASREGRLFYHHAAREISQWNQPPELNSVLGEWVKAVCDDDQPGGGATFWHNELLKISLWKDPRETTNIFQAALDGNLFFLQLYAEVEGHLDVVDPKGRSPLHYCCAGGAAQTASFLIQRRCEVDLRDEADSTPLIFACRYGYASISKILLDAGAHFSAKNSNGNSAIHEAAAMGQLDCLHLLVLFGADTTDRNLQGFTPKELATQNQHFSCVQLLQHQEQESMGAPASHSQFRVRGGRSGVRRRRARRSRVDYEDGSGSNSSDADAGVDPRQHKESESDVGSEDSSVDSDAAVPRSPHGWRRARRSQPLALGLLARGSESMGQLREAFGVVWRRAFPIRADLGLPNAYTFDRREGRWVLNDAGSDIDAEEQDDCENKQSMNRNSHGSIAPLEAVPLSDAEDED